MVYLNILVFEICGDYFHFVTDDNCFVYVLEGLCGALHDRSAAFITADL